jgi:hypothetical protein
LRSEVPSPRIHDNDAFIPDRAQALSDEVLEPHRFGAGDLDGVVAGRGQRHLAHRGGESSAAIG